MDDPIMMHLKEDTDSFEEEVLDILRYDIPRILKAKYITSLYVNRRGAHQKYVMNIAREALGLTPIESEE